MQNLYKVKFVNWECEDYVVAGSVAEIERIGTGVRGKKGLRDIAEIETCIKITGPNTGWPSLLMRRE